MFLEIMEEYNISDPYQNTFQISAILHLLRWVGHLLRLLLLMRLLMRSLLIPSRVVFLPVRHFPDFDQIFSDCDSSLVNF
jgi:hypothetical protein